MVSRILCKTPQNNKIGTFDNKIGRFDNMINEFTKSEFCVKSETWHRRN